MCEFKKKHQICIKFALGGLTASAKQHPVQSLGQIYKFALVLIWSKVCEFELRIKFARTFAHVRI
jgi:hypothetical protein